jgi:SPP1 family predicted phage head-tail adaptor
VPYTDSRLKIGELRHRLQLLRPYGPAQSTFGDVSLANYSPVRTLWGKIESITGRDVLAANQFSDVATHRITIRHFRHNLDIFAKDQVWFQGAGTYVRQFQIEYVLNPDEKNKTLILLCVEIDQSTNQPVGTPPGTLA